MTNPAPTHPARAYLSLVMRPDDLSEEDLAQALNKVLTADLYTIRLQCKMIPPNIVSTLPVHETKRAVDVLHQLGCIAFAPTLEDLSKLGSTKKIKDISLTADGIAFQLWREDEPHIVAPDDIEVLVRARTSETTYAAVPQVAHPRLKSPRRPFGAGIGGFGFAAGGAFGLAVGLQLGHSLTAGSMSGSEAIIDIITKLDIHTRSGTVYQIDGDKFGFDILGPNKGDSDLTNIDRICEYFAGLAPNAAVDPYFQYFKAPANHHQLRIPQRDINNDHPTFAFYSRWVALMYRHLATTTV